MKLPQSMGNYILQMEYLSYSMEIKGVPVVCCVDKVKNSLSIYIYIYIYIYITKSKVSKLSIK